MTRIVTVGGDGRMQLLAELMRRRGCCARWQPEGRDLPEGCHVLLPVPTLDREGCLTGSGGTVSADKLWESLPRGATVAAYLTGEEQERLCCRRADIRLLPMARDEEFLAANGRISALGALQRITQEGMAGERCAVIGYGHLGRPLARLLREMGCPVTVLGRRGGSLERAGEEGFPIVEAGEGSRVPAGTCWLLNTVPASLLGADALTSLPAGCRWVELASPPYGLIRETAEAAGLRWMGEPSLPGRLYPLAAAQAMADSYMRMRERSEGDDA